MSHLTLGVMNYCKIHEVQCEIYSLRKNYTSRVELFELNLFPLTVEGSKIMPMYEMKTKKKTNTQSKGFTFLEDYST